MDWFLYDMKLRHKELMFLQLLSFYILIIICYYIWLLFGLTGFLGSSITRFYNFCDTFDSIAGKDVTISMSKLMRSSISVSEESSPNSSRDLPSICINLIILFKNTKGTRLYKRANQKITR